MLRRLHCALLVLLLVAVGQGEGAVLMSQARCTVAAPVSPTCLDPNQLENLIRRDREDAEKYITSHDETILLRPSVFDNFKDKSLYYCVLHDIVEFYKQVLIRRGGNSTDLRDYVIRMKLCLQMIPCQRQCRKLYQEVKQMGTNETSTDPEKQGSNTKARDVAKLQIYKLQQATKQLDDVKTQEKALFELQTLVFYLPKKSASKKCKNEKKRQKFKCTTKTRP